jgi:fibrillarin-like rRNA methylase
MKTAKTSTGNQVGVGAEMVNIGKRKLKTKIKNEKEGKKRNRLIRVRMQKYQKIKTFKNKIASLLAKETKYFHFCTVSELCNTGVSG